MSAVGNFLFVAFAVNFGLILYTLFLIVAYRIFLKESPADTTEPVLDEVPIEETVQNMEEIPIDV